MFAMAFWYHAGTDAMFVDLPVTSNKATCTPICLLRSWLPGYAGLWVPRWSVMRVIVNGCNETITNVQYPLTAQPI